MPQTEDAQFYQLYFQEPGVAEAELERDPRARIRRMLFGASGDGARPARRRAAAPTPALAWCRAGGGFLAKPGAPALPAWLTAADLDFYAAEFTRTGFPGALNWYRNLDRNWELLAPFAGAPVTVPALYIAGDRDFVLPLPGMDQLLANLEAFRAATCAA